MERLKEAVESLEEENDSLRRGEGLPTSSASSSRKRRGSVLDLDYSSSPDANICASCGGLTKVESEDDGETRENAAPAVPRASMSKRKKVSNESV